MRWDKNHSGWKEWCYIDYLEIYCRELIRKLHGIKSAVLFKVRDALRKTNSYSIDHYFIVSQSAIKDTPTFAHFRSTSEAYSACKMIRLVYRPSYAAIKMLCSTTCRTQFKSSDRCDHAVNYLQVGVKSLKNFIGFTARIKTKCSVVERFRKRTAMSCVTCATNVSLMYWKLVLP